MSADRIVSEPSDREATVVRPYRRDDRFGIRSVACETGFHGEPIDAFYSDHESFADWVTAYYTDCEPDCCFVADRGGRVVGYMLGCTDTRRAYASMRARLLRNLLLRALWLRPGTAGLFLRALVDIAQDGGLRRPHVDLDRYPGHIHMNLLPEARRAHAGVRLLQMAYAHFVRVGCPGVHGHVSANNEGILKAVRAVGGGRLGPPYPVPGLRTRDGERVLGQVLALELPR